MTPEQYGDLVLYEVKTRPATNERYNAFKMLYRFNFSGFAADCVDWSKVKYSDGLTAYQVEIGDRLVERGRMAVRGPHGLGKTAVASLIILWFALTRDGDDWKAITTASAWRQLTKYLWPEITRKWVRVLNWSKIGRAPFREGQELLQMGLKLETGEAFAVASNEPALIEGAHADHLLYVFDEAKVIPDATFDAAEGAFAGAGEESPLEAFALAISTPGDPNGRFYDIHKRAAGLEDWSVRHVTLEETIQAGRVTRSWSESRARLWGEDSAVYLNRVMGEFASSDEDALIPLRHIEAANDRWRQWKDDGFPGLAVGVGVDVADGGRDSTVFANRVDQFRPGDTPADGDEPIFIGIKSLESFAKAETMETAGRIEGRLSIRPPDTFTAVIDAVAVGAGVCSRLIHDLKRPNVVRFVGSKKGTRKTRDGQFSFNNKRSEAWFNMRELLDPVYGYRLCLPPDDELTGQLTAPTWSILSNAVIQVEPKKKVVERTGKSPDKADAVVMVLHGGDKPSKAKSKSYR